MRMEKSRMRYPAFSRLVFEEYELLEVSGFDKFEAPTAAIAMPVTIVK
jgi:hypothetical protein